MNFLIVLLPIFFSLAQAEVALTYKFQSKESRALFDKQNGSECVHKAGRVRECGKNHLLANNSNDSAAYETCIKGLEFPFEFEEEALTLKASDFKSIIEFEDVYNKILSKYAKKLDEKHVGKQSNPNIFEFSINWLALLIIPLAFVIIYLFNRKSSNSSKNENISNI